MKLLIVLALAAFVYTANGASLNKRDLRDDLLTRAAELEKEAAAEVTKLRAAGHTAAAAAIEREEKRLQALATELKAATDAAAITRLDNEVRAIERRIDEEIHRAEGSSRPPRSTRPAASTAATTAASIVKRDLRDDLLTRAAELEKEAAAEVTKLRAAGHTAAAAAIEREEKRLQALATELKAATDAAAITRLDNEVRAIERRIDEEIHRAEGSSRPPRSTRPAASTAATTAASIVKRDLRDDLLTRAAELEKEAAAEVTKLRAAGHTAAAAAIEREEKRLQALATELKAATDAAAITRLDNEVRAIERRIDEEIHRAEGSSRPPRSTRPAATTAATTAAF